MALFKDILFQLTQILAKKYAYLSKSYTEMGYYRIVWKTTPRYMIFSPKKSHYTRTRGFKIFM